MSYFEAEVSYLGQHPGEDYIPPAYAVSSNVVVIPQMLVGAVAFYVRGCIAYSTNGATAKSGFCFFGQPHGKDGGFASIQCRDGNTAEGK